VTTAKLARELFGTPWIKLEVIADNDTLQPDVVGLVEAAAILIKDGFEVFPYCTEDLGVAMRLVDAGCKVVMPWAAPIGSAKGIINRDALKLLRDRLPDITLVVDAGLGAPSHAAHALELGYDAVLLNTAIAKAIDPVAMATAFRLAVESGRTAFEAGLMEARDFASPSTPVIGTPFWHAVS
jgi:thiazole synthase